MGLKVCVDHPKLRELRQEMSEALEERTSPPITPVFLAKAKVNTPPQALEEGRHLYTNRCTECHDLEMVDSRSISGWQKAVAGMSGRAHVNEVQQARILDYLAAALNGMEAAR
jgi:cytochrome c2